MGEQGVLSMGLPDKKRKMTDLEPAEKARISHDAFYAWATQGATYKSLSEKHNLSLKAVKQCIMEYSAFIREERPDTKAANMEAYRWLQMKAAHIIENLDNYPQLVATKAFEAYIQSLTRLDKLGGHEAPTTNVNVDGETLAEMIQKKFGAANPSGDISPVDAGMVEDEIVEGEVVEDEDDDEFVDGEE